MSGTMTVKELIVELLDQDMDDKVYVWRDFDPLIGPHALELSLIDASCSLDAKKGVYLFTRYCYEP